MIVHVLHMYIPLENQNRTGFLFWAKNLKDIFSSILYAYNLYKVTLTSFLVDHYSCPKL